ncbi:MAG: hypothetical protein ACQESR_00305 [Planctomycetota bacterium]
MIALLIGVFLLILFIVAVILSASTWRGWHIAATCLTFLATLGFLILASLSQKTHAKWRGEYADLEERLAEAEALGVKLEIGDPRRVQSEEPSVNALQERLSRLLLDRGRVWRRCVAPNPPQDGRIVISTIPLKPDGTPSDPNAAEDNGLENDMILYGFHESRVALGPEEGAEQVFAPVVYMGEFQVVDAQPNQVTLTPTMPLDGEQRRLFSDTSASWALYEMMPADSHRIFSEEDTVGRLLDNTMEQPVFGKMDEQRVRQMFATVTGLAPDAPRVTQLVEPYLKDGKAATDRDMNLYPTNIWQKLEFEKEHAVQVDSSNPDMGVEGTFFDHSGYAVASPLRRGEGDQDLQPAILQENDIGLFPYGHSENRQQVDRLVEEEICRKIGPIYVRSLRDYEEAFHNIQRRFIQGKQDIAEANRNIERLETAISKAQEQVAYRQGEQEKLEEDETGFDRDNTKMGQLVDALEAQKAALSQELSDLHKTNLALSRQLAIFSAKLTEEINRRAANVAAN